MLGANLRSSVRAANDFNFWVVFSALRTILVYGPCKYNYRSEFGSGSWLTEWRFMWAFSGISKKASPIRSKACSPGDFEDGILLYMECLTALRVDKELTTLVCSATIFALSGVGWLSRQRRHTTNENHCYYCSAWQGISTLDSPDSTWRLSLKIYRGWVQQGMPRIPVPGRLRPEHGSKSTWAM